uniref:GB1/RHD3-type G domain-containing protein n=1 Tax=Timema monikensis TaxID=170555 RepID=A0A7R9E9F5_9NEOP|nr:unnamed protein product [Timema monikensis]
MAKKRVLTYYLCQGEQWHRNGYSPTNSVRYQATMTGRAVQILQTQNNNVTQFDNEALEAVFLREDVRDKRVVVVSISGIFGKGKSFLLNYMLRYLNSQVNLVCLLRQCDPLWLNNKTAPLEGFSWGGRSKRETTGLLMWSEPFLISLPGGEQVAVVLVDTQGTFDIDTIVQECATVFSLSLLISSVQVFNLSRNITEHDLQHLLVVELIGLRRQVGVCERCGRLIMTVVCQLFTEYARQALGEDVERPFQKLQLLVRDWATPHLALFGPEGGKQLFNHLMQASLG